MGFNSGFKGLKRNVCVTAQRNSMGVTRFDVQKTIIH